MLGERPKWQKRKDAMDSKGRDGTLDLRMQGPSMRMCEVVMMRVFIDKCVVMVVEIAKAKRKHTEPRRACQRERATSWAGSTVTGLPTWVPSFSISSKVVAGSGSHMRTVPSSPQVANITAVGHHSAELTPFF